MMNAKVVEKLFKKIIYNFNFLGIQFQDSLIGISPY